MAAETAVRLNLFVQLAVHGRRCRVMPFLDLVSPVFQADMARFRVQGQGEGFGGGKV